MDYYKVIETINRFEIDEQVKERAHKEIAPFRNNAISDNQILQAKKAAVLLLIHPNDNKAHFTLIERASYDGIHSKQIALPGGKFENEDINIFETALREAKEEVNISNSDVEIVSSLSTIFIPPSNFYITPVLGISQKRPHYIPEEKEVNDILEVSLSELLNPQVVKQTNIRANKQLNYTTPYLDLGNKIVWGATAMILNELRHFLMKNNL